MTESVIILIFLKINLSSFIKKQERGTHKRIIYIIFSKQFQEHCIDLEVQLQSISAQRDTGVMELSKCHERMQADASAIYNLQNALEQLEKGKYFGTLN